LILTIGMIRIFRLFRSNRSKRTLIWILLHPNTNPPSNITYIRKKKKITGKKERITNGFSYSIHHFWPTWKLQKRCRLSKENFCGNKSLTKLLFDGFQ
jgi:hypothetical protein